MNTKLSPSTLSKDSPITALYKRESKNALRLMEAGIHTLMDLFWTLPLRIEMIPPPRPFSEIVIGKTFCGEGKVISVKAYPNFRARGKRGALLYTANLIIKDLASEQTVAAKWFNSYSSVVNQLKELDEIRFHGIPQIYGDTISFVNPIYTEIAETSSPTESLEIIYPTINGVSGDALADLFKRVPDKMWEEIVDPLPPEIVKKRNLFDLKKSIKTIHARDADSNYSKENFDKAKKRLIYSEFVDDQAKIFTRKILQKRVPATIIQSTHDELNTFLNHFPFTLTADQKNALEDILRDLATGNPMMRLIQGDVGTGKTAVATIAALFALKKGQVALMCPTESLAQQHYRTLTSLFQKLSVSHTLLIGSTPPKEKKIIASQIASGDIQFVIGTHALIQDGIKFKQMVLSIIDEQHKFGVDQRVKLASKNEGVHTLIMTATPIPRSLSLTQYGDLDISIIREIPAGRKGIKTKIITPENFQNFLTFIKTRISLGEQVYVVTPAILDNEENDFLALEEVFNKLSTLFAKEKVLPLHGRMKSVEKEQTLVAFSKGEVDILVSTSVIEVGINVPRATVMAIFNPERFGLSSLHQLRGRVGRGDKPGFCFLVTDRTIGVDAMERLTVIEGTTDGFRIAEEDLRLRGEGDLFGTVQAGSISSRKLSNIIDHQELLLAAREDLTSLIAENHPFALSLIEKIKEDQRITLTI